MYWDASAIARPGLRILFLKSCVTIIDFRVLLLLRVCLDWKRTPLNIITEKNSFQAYFYLLDILEPDTGIDRFRKINLKTENISDN